MAQSHIAVGVFGRLLSSGCGPDCGYPVPPHPNPLPEEREKHFARILVIRPSVVVARPRDERQGRRGLQSQHQNLPPCQRSPSRGGSGEGMNRTPTVDARRPRNSQPRAPCRARSFQFGYEALAVRLADAANVLSGVRGIELKEDGYHVFPATTFRMHCNKRRPTRPTKSSKSTPANTVEW
jgi:hypothetical protein